MRNINYSPKVSVIIPTYNRGKYIKEAVDSVLSQAFQDFEIIVIDDGSTDNTREVLSLYSDKIEYIYQENKGISCARNTGIRCSNGEYIAFLDSDDMWLEDKLELQVRFLDKNRDVDMVYSGIYYFDEMFKINRDYFDLVKPYSGFVLKHLFLRNFIPCVTVIVRKKCFEKIGLFDETLVFSEDYDMWMRVAMYFKIDFINKPLARFRIHKDSMTAIVSDIKRYLDEIKVSNKILHFCPTLRDELGISANKKIAALFFMLGTNFFKKNDYSKARSNLFHSIKLYPCALRKYILLLFTILPRAIAERYKDRILLLYEK